MNDTDVLLTEISQCQLCSERFPHPCNPILQFSPHAKVLLIGQAPGRITNELNLPFKDPSGDRLRNWLNVTEKKFYDQNIFAIMPMAFCYPGKLTSGSGDAPPPKICQKTWHDKLLAQLPKRQMTLLIGNYATKQYLPEFDNLTSAIQASSLSDSNVIALPHPSPRNNIWLKRNDWFETKTLPLVRQRLASILKV